MFIWLHLNVGLKDAKCHFYYFEPERFQNHNSGDNLQEIEAVPIDLRYFSLNIQLLVGLFIYQMHL